MIVKQLDVEPPSDYDVDLVSSDKPMSPVAPYTESDVAQPPSASEFVMLPLASVSASAGPGEEAFHEEVAGYVGYSRTQMRRETGMDPAQMVILVISGSSMLPTLTPGDRLIVARYQGEPIFDGAIYVLRNRYGGVMVKRTFWTTDGELEIRGDNEQSPSGKIDLEQEDSDWAVIGKVVRVEKPL